MMFSKSKIKPKSGQNMIENPPRTTCVFEHIAVQISQVRYSKNRAPVQARARFLQNGGFHMGLQNDETNYK